jgi:hypothetical protein
VKADGDGGVLNAYRDYMKNLEQNEERAVKYCNSREVTNLYESPSKQQVQRRDTSSYFHWGALALGSLLGILPVVVLSWRLRRIRWRKGCQRSIQIWQGAIIFAVWPRLNQPTTRRWRRLPSSPCSPSVFR